MRKNRRIKWLIAVASALLLVAVAGCGTDSGGDDDDGGGQRPAPRASRRPTCRWLEELGDPEGQVNILAWPGYAEDGSTDQPSTGSPPSRRRPAARPT